MLESWDLQPCPWGRFKQWVRSHEDLSWSSFFNLAEQLFSVAYYLSACVVTIIILISNKVIGPRISKFEITSAITPWSVRHEAQLIINRNYNKIREEYDSGINSLTGWYIQLLDVITYAKWWPIQVQLARAWWCVLFKLCNYSGMTCATVQ